MRILKESVLQIWKARKAAVREELASAERAAKAIQGKLDRVDEAFLFERSIDIETYDRHAAQRNRSRRESSSRFLVRPLTTRSSESGTRPSGRHS